MRWAAGYMTRAMKSGDWSARNHPGVRRIAGRTLGLVGFGASSQAVAERAKPFGLKILAWTRTPEKHRAAAQRLGVEFRQLDDLLHESDFVSLHLPLNPETTHLLDERRISLMKSGAVLINTARGALVDEAAWSKRSRKSTSAAQHLTCLRGSTSSPFPKIPQSMS